MSKINELRAQRAKTWEQTKAFLDHQLLGFAAGLTQACIFQQGI